MPTKFRVYRDIVRLEPGAEARGWVLSNLPERLRDVVQEVSDEIPFLDLTSALSAAASDGALPYFADDSHWNAEGHRVAAAAIAEVITRSSCGSAPPSPQRSPGRPPRRC
ncbi:MAG: alginate O-acetyltransferase AlgX-related protein [Vicinamibacteria bacterium]